MRKRESGRASAGRPFSKPTHAKCEAGDEGSVTIVSDVMVAPGKDGTWVAITEASLSTKEQGKTVPTRSARRPWTGSIVERAMSCVPGNLVQAIEAVTTTTARSAVLATQEIWL